VNYYYVIDISCEVCLHLPVRSVELMPFLARDSIFAIARYMISPVRPPVCPSVCLSVTQIDESKTVEVMIMQLSSQSSTMTLVSSRLTSPQDFKGNIGAGRRMREG